LTEITKVFQDNIDLYDTEHITLNKKDNMLSAIRLALFIMSISLAIYAANDRNGLLLSVVLLLFFIIFGILIRYHNKVKFKSKTSLFLKNINEEELQRSKGVFQKLKKGEEYFDKNHSYSPDLDVFGSNSLFQLIIRSKLLLTQKLAAKWMLTLADEPTIIQRQDAIKELVDKPKWRQYFTSFGMHSEDAQIENQLTSFEQWMINSNEFIERKFWITVNFFMPLFSLVTIIGIVFFSLPYQVIFISIIINAFILKIILKPILKITEDFDKAQKSLKVYEYLFASIENTDFESEKLEELKAQMSDGSQKASKSIKSLRLIVDQLQNRGNMIYSSFNILFILDVYWLRQAEKWKRKNALQAQKWFTAVHEFDLLSDMASFSFANRKYTYPKIIHEKFTLKAKELGHPLIRSTDRVANTFEFSERGFIGLITGSNMSGKSTFLRTVGLNLVMAQIGLPVCAKSFSFSLTRIFTGMRSTDNLEESVSSFYAELARIKTLLDSINDEEPILFLLDEILKGTNSEDRHKGSISLIKQLSEKNAFGLISTHDLALSSLEKDNPRIKNYSFNSTIEGNEILFDYKLTNGPCRSFNASKLMEKMGIIV